MNRIALLLLSVAIFAGCCKTDRTPRAKHVILIGLDGFGAYDLQKAHTPNLNEMAAKGALSLKTRCVLESSSSQNWMSMLSGATPIQHGVTSNEWEPELHDIVPVLQNKKGFFPSVFDDIKSQKPEYKAYMFYEWKGLGRMFDLSVPDKVENLNTGEKVISEGFRSFFVDQPEFLFIAVDETDHLGHLFGHESAEYYKCITRYDSIIGDFAKKLKAEGMLDNTVVILTADHGGIEKGHGGTTPNEMQIPVLLYGGNVTKGKVIEQAYFIPDIAATVGGLLGVKLPDECIGKFIFQAFEPLSDVSFAPIPVISPESGFYKEPVKINLNADPSDVKIYFTTNGKEADASSTLYEKPFIIDATSTIKAVTVVGKTISEEASATFRIAGTKDEPGVQYRYYENYQNIITPDFRNFGKPLRQGMIHELSLGELGLKDKDHFAVEFTSNINIETAGKYAFELTSDDGSKLYIDDKLLCDNDGSHGRITRYSELELKKGIHSIRIDYFDDYGSEYLMVRWKTPGGVLEVLPFSKLMQTGKKP